MGAPREDVAPRNASPLGQSPSALRHLREAGVSSLEFSPRHLVSIASFRRCAHCVRQLSGESGWALGWVIRIQVSESAVRTRNGMERMVWPISWSTT